jgi:hypothetical protein
MSDVTESAASHFLAAAVADLRKYKGLAEKVFEQLDDADFFFKPDGESNSISILVKHLSGNMRSRWTDIFTTDGEKPNRNRDGEFLEDQDDRAKILSTWHVGWDRLFETLGDLSEADLLRTIYIRGKPLSVLEAVVRQLAHYAYHVGQIVYIGKHLRQERWRTLSIPKGRSDDYVPR